MISACQPLEKYLAATGPAPDQPRDHHLLSRIQPLASMYSDLPEGKSHFPVQFPLSFTVGSFGVRNRFKGPDLIDRVLDELWTEVPDIVQETGIKTISMEKKCKKAKWLSGEAKFRETPPPCCQRIHAFEEKERYTHLNAEFQRRARRDKKAFLSDQCKEIEENNRMGPCG